MNNRNPDSPWNPQRSIEITPRDFELFVWNHLRESGVSLVDFQCNHQEHLTGPCGDYEFDVVAKFTIFDGANITVVIECKKYTRPVEREKILALWAKQQDVSAHKAMVFSTSGYQSGALEYASSKRIAAVIVANGDFMYETRSYSDISPKTPDFITTKHVGVLISKTENNMTCKTIDCDNAISEFLSSE